MERGRSHRGRATRGKTAAHRLRRVDVLAVLLGLPPVDAPLFVDLGYGADAVTTLESAGTLRRARRELRVIGVENDRARVDAATPFNVEGSIDFRFGGFDLALRSAERPGLVRAMNVLRQYPEAEYAAAIAAMTASLTDGGALFEGTSSPTGRLITVNIWERAARDVRSRGVVLSVNLRRPWEPRELQTVLPKNWIHHVAPGSDLDQWFEHWERSVREARALHRSPRRVFADAAQRLRSSGAVVDLRPALLDRGFLLTRWQ